MSAMDSTLPAEQPTLRDQFAMAALSAILSTEERERAEFNYRRIALESYRLADAMLEARKPK